MMLGRKVGLLKNLWRMSGDDKLLWISIYPFSILPFGMLFNSVALTLLQGLFLSCGVVLFIFRIKTGRIFKESFL